jgi:MoaA/NifB/PqqE/SkfB family radical SAM enzyme
MEINRRNLLKLKKPLVYDKVIKFDEKLARGESIGIIQLQYNYFCNFRCIHCSIKPMQTANEGKRKLTIPDIKNIYAEADSIGLARTTITGGEPLVFTDLDELVKAINPEKFYINCDTNGWLMSPAKAKHLKDIGVDRIQLSLDSLDQKEHDDFRRTYGSFEHTINAVDYILDAGLDIFMQTVVTKQRLYSDEFIKYLEYFGSLGISVFVSFAKPVGAWEGNFDALMDKDDLEYMNALEKKYNVFTHLTAAYGLSLGCPAGKNIFSITQFGDVLICPYFYCSMGNIFNESLKDILNRCMRLKPFKKDTCLLAEDREFINKYLVKKIYGHSLPVPYKEVFIEEEFE